MAQVAMEDGTGSSTSGYLKHEDRRSWPLPLSQPGAIKPPPPPSIPVGIYYPDSYQASLLV